MRLTSLVARPIALVLIAHLILSLGFNLATPVFEASDEPNHFLFVRYLQLRRELPVQGASWDGPRAHHPPGYFLLGALITAWVPLDPSVDTVHMLPNPHFTFRFGDAGVDNKAAWVHDPAVEGWPYRGMSLAVHLIRLLSLSFSTLAVWLTFRSASRLRPGDPAFATLAAGLLAFNPSVLFISGAINNDMAAMAACAWIVYHLGSSQRSTFTPRYWVVLGILFGVGILLKANVLMMAIPIAFVLLGEMLRTRAVRQSILAAVYLVLAVLSVAGWWFARNHALYGDWTGNAAIVRLTGEIPAEQQLDFLPQFLYPLLTGMLGRFGTGLGVIRFPDSVYWLGGLVFLFAIAGLAKLWILDRRRPSIEGNPVFGDMWSVHLLTVLTVFVSVVVFMLNFPSATLGRYMFPAYPSLALLLAAGLLAWFRPRWRTWAATAVVLTNLSLAVYGLVGVEMPAFVPPRSPTSAEIARMHALDAAVVGTAQIMGYELDQSSVAAGETLSVTVHWLPESKTDRPYTVFVHLYAPEVGSIAQRDTYPGLGNYATMAWTPGRSFIDTYRLYLSDDVPATSSARILIGLYDERTQERLPTAGADANAEERWIGFGTVEVRSRADAAAG